MSNETKEIALVELGNNKGVLKTNIEELETFVAEKLIEYTPENYTGNADDAKKARAVLNNSKKLISSRRIEIIRNAMARFCIDSFETRCKNVEKDIITVSNALDSIVKTKEQEEKDEKKSIIDAFWACTQFDLFPVDKVFNEKWLNKGYKEKDIKKDIADIQEKTFSELQIIERLPEDVTTLKAIYLDTLDLSTTLKQSDILKKNREVAEREEASRKKRTLEKQQNDLGHEEYEAQENQPVVNLASAALEEEPEDDPEMTFTAEFTGKKSDLFAMRQFMTDHGITYKKL